MIVIDKVLSDKNKNTTYGPNIFINENKMSNMTRSNRANNGLTW